MLLRYAVSLKRDTRPLSELSVRRQSYQHLAGATRASCLSSASSCLSSVDAVTSALCRAQGALNEAVEEL